MGKENRSFKDGEIVAFCSLNRRKTLFYRLAYTKYGFNEYKFIACIDSIVKEQPSGLRKLRKAEKIELAFLALVGINIHEQKEKKISS
jgi:hypothetical protein